MGNKNRHRIKSATGGFFIGLVDGQNIAWLGGDEHVLQLVPRGAALLSRCHVALLMPFRHVLASEMPSSTCVMAGLS